MKTIVNICRILVGALFVVSGLIKVNDSVGFSYKMEEYFAESALNWTIFEPYALVIAMFVAVFEVLLGFATLFGAKMKATATLLLLMILFFTGLTYYTAKCIEDRDNKTEQVQSNEEEIVKTCVDDCGCFGDALKGSIGRSLTPKESFYKDIILLILILPIFTYSFWRGILINTQREDLFILPFSILFVIGVGVYLFSWWFTLWFTLFVFALYILIKKLNTSIGTKEWSILLMSTLVTTAFLIYTVRYLPQKDFRPYAVGKSLAEQMKTAEELGVKPALQIIEYHIEHKETGETKVIRNVDFGKYAKDWKFVKTGREYAEDGYVRPIPPEFEDINYEMIENIKNGDAFLLYVAYDIEHTSIKPLGEIKKVYEYSQSNGIPFYATSSSGTDELVEFEQKHNLPFSFTFGDDKLLKTIVRSNPGLLYVKDGIVKAKWSKRCIPTVEDLKEIQ